MAQYANGQGLQGFDPQHAVTMGMHGRPQAPSMPPRPAAGPAYAPQYGHVPGMGPPGPQGPNMGMHAGMQGAMGGMGAGTAYGMQGGMPPGMPYGAMGPMQGMPPMQGAMYGAGAEFPGTIPPPVPVVTTKNRLGKGLSSDNRELRWKLFVGQVPQEVRCGGA